MIRTPPEPPLPAVIAFAPAAPLRPPQEDAVDPAEESLFQLGERIADRFEIERLAGTGGMGHIYRAVDLSSGQPVAVKVLHCDQGATVPRFERESRLLKEIDHPHVVRHVTDGVLPSGDRYLVMEWLEGEDLSVRLSRGRLGIAEAVALGGLVADALGELHARGIVHRDVKPSNIFLVEQRIEALKLLDLGIARSDRTARVTRTGSVMGTLAYMAPEQARGDPSLDARVDVFALGCVLYECLTGKTPFTGGFMSALLAKLLFVPAPRLRESVPQAPPALEDLIARMLAKPRQERPRDGRAAAEALRELSVATVELPPLPPGDAAALDAPTKTLELSPPGPTTRLRGAGNAAALPPLTRPRRAAAISEAEQRTLCLFLIGAGAGDDADEARLEAVAAALEPQGTRFVRLMGGLAAVLVAGPSIATDLAVRAARAALAVREVAPELRITVATGCSDAAQQLPGAELIDRAASLLGDEPSEAALPGAASRIRLDEATAALLSERFDVLEEGGALLLRGPRKGEGEPARRGDSPRPCFGRERDLRVLEGLFEDCSSDGSAQVAVVKAPPGVGKSRLGRELAARVRAREEPASIWSARCEEAEAATPLGVLARLVRSVERAGEEEGTQPEAAAAFLDLARAACARGPLLILIDDLQWCDAATAQAIDRALSALHDAPLFLVALARVEVDEVFPKLWPKRRVHEIRLLELPRRAAERMVRHALGDAAEPAVVERIVALAEGNPFALEELIRAAAKGQNQALPEALVALERSRLLGLDAGARRLLRAASVYGSPFSAEAVAAVAGDTDSAEGLADRLADLVQREILAVKLGKARASGEVEYVFWHALRKQAAYSMLTPEDLTLAHRLAGEWLERRGKSSALELAAHFALAGEEERAAAHRNAGVA